MNSSPRRFRHVAALALAFAPLAWAAEQKPAAAKAPAPLVGSVDRASAVYQRGETIAFTFHVEPDGQPAASGEVEWALTKDGLPPFRTGRVNVDRGRVTVTGSLDEPGFVQCRATFVHDGKKLTALAGAAVAPTEIKPSQPPPDDFAAFWDAKKKLLAAVPIRAQLTPAPSPVPSLETFDLQADSVGAPVSGYFARPAGAKVRSLPAILTVHGAGVRSASLSAAAGWARGGLLALDLNAHGLPNGRETAFYEALATGDLRSYRTAGRESRETIYFLGMFLRLVRAIDFLTGQPEWDGRTLVVFGSSQGGAQAIAAAGLDPRVSFFAAGVPAMCDHTGFLAQRISGWPKFVPTAEKDPPPEVVAAIRYYDAVNFAARTKAPGFFTIGFIDTTCPPTSVYAAYNALRSPKDIFHDIAAGHTNTPAATAAMRAAVKRHLAAMK
ncbi:MAG: acetylxylan esterase [Verrucomicrobia bacterium]|nr:acetylxylan esterase [Verrucomicrobiota bacterium]